MSFFNVYDTVFLGENMVIIKYLLNTIMNKIFIIIIIKYLNHE